MIAPNSQLTGIDVSTQVPLDAKTYFKTIVEMQDLGYNSQKAFKYYKGMVCYCVETNRLYIWNPAPEDSVGVLETAFTYPSNSLVDGIDYSGTDYNFFEFNPGNISNVIYEIHFMLDQTDIEDPQVTVLNPGTFPEPEELTATYVQEGKYALVHPLLQTENIPRIDLFTNNYAIVGNKEYFININLDNKFYIETVDKVGDRVYRNDVLKKQRFILYFFPEVIS